MEEKLVGLFFLIMAVWGLHNIGKSAPAAFRFGIENREMIKGGLSFLKRLFGK